MTLIEQMALAAQKKLAEQINRSAGQHQRAIKRAFDKLTKTKKPQAANAVESSELGETDSTSTKAASAEKTQAINDALGLQMILRQPVKS